MGFDVEKCANTVREYERWKLEQRLASGPILKQFKEVFGAKAEYCDNSVHFPDHPPPGEYGWIQVDGPNKISHS